MLPCAGRSPVVAAIVVGPADRIEPRHKALPFDAIKLGTHNAGKPSLGLGRCQISIRDRIKYPVALVVQCTSDNTRDRPVRGG